MFGKRLTAPLNRTLLELKLSSPTSLEEGDASLNRTLLELKRLNASQTVGHG